jgi:protein SPT2
MTSSGFAALMALSQARTQESTRAADSINAERRRKDEARRRQQEEEDRKEREQQAKMLRYRLEEQKREKERQLKREQEREAKLKAMERREEEQRQAMLYGPKKSRERTSRYPTSSAATRRTFDDDDEGDAGLALTREEKRERRLQLQFSQNAARRSGSSVGTSRTGRRLPGGALNATAQHSQTGGGSANGRSVRERLTAMPNTLTKLNTVKRDTRTIDEILRDRAKARENKTLEGEEAREFHDWFGTNSKAATTMKTSFPPSPTASGASTPSLLPQRPDTIPSANKKSSSPRPTVSRTPSYSSSLSTPKTTSKVSSHGTKFPRPAPLTNKITAGLSTHTPTKRPRSAPSSYDGSESDSEYDRRPPKRAAGASSGIQDEIWKIFGRDRSKYMSRTVMSDDEDMEADMTALEREELTRFVPCIFGSVLIV